MRARSGTCASAQPRMQTRRAGDEYGDEDETSLQIFGLRGWRWSPGEEGEGGQGEGGRGRGEGCQVRGKSHKIGPMFACACKSCAAVDSPDGAQDACKCMFCSYCGVWESILNCCLMAVKQFAPPSYRFPPHFTRCVRVCARVCECQTIGAVCIFGSRLLRLHSPPPPTPSSHPHHES